MSNKPNAPNHTNNARLAFIGGGNMAQALGLGLIGQQVRASDVLVVDPSETAREPWQTAGTAVAEGADVALSKYNIWVFAVKPQQLKEVVLASRPFLRPDTLVLSLAAGIRATDISQWLGTPEQPFQRVVRCMPNTPALVQQGVTGMHALAGVYENEKEIASHLLAQVGSVVWVADDTALDAVTALSGSGPAYVFLFLEALIEGGQSLGLDAEQARALALQTVKGAVSLAAQSNSSIEQLRHNVTSEGGTTAAALSVFEQGHFKELVAQAMQAAQKRAQAMADEFSR